MIKNYISTPKQTREGSHDGIGPYDLFEIWGRSDFQSGVDFIDRMTIPPGSTVGYHKHGNNEEMYVVLEGQGTMTINNSAHAIKKGDMALNPPGGEHGLVNDSNADIELLVIQLSLPG